MPSGRSALRPIRSNRAVIVAAAQAGGDMARAASLVSPALLRVGVAGGAAELIARLEGLAAAGARHLSFGPPLGPDVCEALRILGREVLPHFR